MRSSGAPVGSPWASVRRRCTGARLVLVLVLAATVAQAPAARAEVFESVEEALARAFPEADRFERRNVLLDAEQARAIEARARAKLESRIVPVHVAHRGDALLGYAIVDVHTVRTVGEALLVVLDPDGRVRSLRLLAFHEPPEYRPPDRWLAQFEGRTAEDRLRLGREIHGIAGATLSSQAVTRAVRRALALHAVALAPQPKVPPRAETPAAAPESGEEP